MPHMMVMNLFFFFFYKQKSYILYQNTDFKITNLTLAVNDNNILIAVVTTTEVPEKCTAARHET